MKKTVELGGIFELKTITGKAYIQCINIPNHNNEVELIKVYYTIHKESVSDINLIVDGEYFMIRFPLKAAFRRKIVSKIGNVPLSEHFELPKYLRRIHSFKNETLCWQIIDTCTEQFELVEKLSDKQVKLSPWGGMNDTLIIELLERGWRLENWTTDNMFLK